MDTSEFINKYSIEQEDYDMLAGENKAMAEFLELIGLTQEEISNVANGSIEPTLSQKFSQRGKYNQVLEEK